jgi:hypothetical protein
MHEMNIDELVHTMMTGLNADGAPYEPASLASAATQQSDRTKGSEKIGVTFKNGEACLFEIMGRMAKKIAFDLTNMASVDAGDLIEHLTDADVIIALFPGCMSLMDETMFFRVSKKKSKRSKLGVLKFNNLAQLEILSVALFLIDKGDMGPLQAAALCSMLASVQNTPAT